MRKRIVIYLSALVLGLTTLNGCKSAGPPKGMAQETYDLGMSFLNMYDSYEKNVLSSDEFYEKYQDVIHKILASSFDDSSNEIHSITIANDVNSFNIHFIGGKDTSDDISKLKKDLGVK